MGAYTFRPEELNNIKALYLEGNSSQEIKDALSLPQTTRSIQRFLKKEGIIRSMGDAFRNAVERNRVNFRKKETKIKRLKVSPILRHKILTRDGFRCLHCGATAKDRLLEIDHIDFNVRNNAESNLQTLCEFCNRGRVK